MSLITETNKQKTPNLSHKKASPHLAVFEEIVWNHKLLKFRLMDTQTKEFIDLY